MAAATLTLYIRHGHAPAGAPPLEHALAEAAAQRPDETLWWVEPRPRLPATGRGRLLARTLGAGMPPSEVALEEARLFHAQGGLHWLADERGGYRWLEYAEQPWPEATATLSVAREPAQPVLTLRDAQRFGYAEAEPWRDLGPLRLVNYRHGGEILAWRLWFDDGEGE